MLANRQNVRIISEDIQNSIEKTAREYRRPEIAHAFGVNGVMGGSLLPVTSDAHRKVICQPLANFSACFPGNGEQLRIIVFRQIRSEVCMLAIDNQPIGWSGSAAQFNCCGGTTQRNFLRRPAQFLGVFGTRG